MTDDDPCCSNPAIQAFSFRQDGERWANNICLRCKAHWYGPEGAEARYTRLEWEAYINAPAIT